MFCWTSTRALARSRCAWRQGAGKCTGWSPISTQWMTPWRMRATTAKPTPSSCRQTCPRTRTWPTWLSMFLAQTLSLQVPPVFCAQSASAVFGVVGRDEAFTLLSVPWTCRGRGLTVATCFCCMIYLVVLQQSDNSSTEAHLVSYSSCQVCRQLEMTMTSDLFTCKVDRARPVFAPLFCMYLVNRPTERSKRCLRVYWITSVG